MIENFVSSIVGFVQANQGWIAPVTFTVAFLESFCFLSLIWPGTAILIGISALLVQSGIEWAVLWPAILWAGVGGALGYSISYWLGAYYKEDIVKLYPFSRHPEMVVRGQNFFDSWGAISVFFGHFFGPVRAVIPVVAGMYALPQWQFQIANIISSFIWAGGVIAPTYFGLQFLLG